MLISCDTFSSFMLFKLASIIYPPYYLQLRLGENTWLEGKTESGREHRLAYSYIWAKYLQLIEVSIK